MTKNTNYKAFRAVEGDQDDQLFEPNDKKTKRFGDKRLNLPTRIVETKRQRTDL